MSICVSSCPDRSALRSEKSLILGCFVIAMSTPSVLDAQGTPRATIRVGDRLSCNACRVRSQEVARLTIPSMSSDPFPRKVIEDGSGRYWVIRRGGPPLVFERGSTTPVEVGRSGSGPGEYQSIYSIVPVPGDSVAIFDAGRATILNARTRVGRSAVLPFSMGWPTIIAWPDRVYVTASLNTVTEAGLKLHELSFARSPVERRRSLAVGDEILKAGSPTGSPRLSPANGKDFWAALPGRYELVRINREGRPEQTIVRRSALYDFTILGYHDYEKPPPSYVIGLIQQEDGSPVWVFLGVPAPTWKEAVRPEARGRGEIFLKDIALEKEYHAMLEVIDPVKGAVVQRLAIPGYLINAMPGPKAAFYSEDDEGNVTVRIVSYAIDGR